MLKRLSESELDVMLVVWRAQEALDTGEVARRLQKGWKIQAVQVVLGRLVEKGYLSCEKIGRLNYYTPLVAEADYRAAETETFVEKLYRNSPKSLIAALVQSQPLSKEDLEEIRALLDRGEESYCWKASVSGC